MDLKSISQGLAAALAAAMFCAACHDDGGGPVAASGTPRARDVLLISVDTLRADHMSLYGYERPTTPNLDRVFGDAAVFLRAYTTESNTPASIASLLTGLPPRKHGVRLFYQILDKDVPTVADFLENTHTTAAFVSNMVLTDEAMGMAGRFDHYDDFVATKESARTVFERNAQHTTDAVLNWLDDASIADGEPVFVWVHYIDPHGPYRAPTDWPRTFRHALHRQIEPARINEYQLTEGEADGYRYVDAYDEEIAYTDAEAARLILGFDERRGIDDALVLLTADHGETMMEGERWFAHGFQVYESLIRVPLIALGPGVKKGERTELVSTIDVLPTILDFCGVRADSGLSGRSLLSPHEPDTRVVFSESTERGTQWRAALRGSEKWVIRIHADGGNARIVERRAYDLSDDPEERRPADWSSHDPAQDALIAEFRSDPDPAGIPAAYAEGRRLRAPKLARRPSPLAEKALRALGYLD